MCNCIVTIVCLVQHPSKWSPGAAVADTHLARRPWHDHAEFPWDCEWVMLLSVWQGLCSLPSIFTSRLSWSSRMCFHPLLSDWQAPAVFWIFIPIFSSQGAQPVLSSNSYQTLQRAAPLRPAKILWGWHWFCSVNASSKGIALLVTPATCHREDGHPRIRHYKVCAYQELKHQCC